MKELGGSEHQPNDRIRMLVENALVQISGNITEPPSEHEDLVHETRVLKSKLAEKRRRVPINDKFGAGMYSAAYYLADAIDFVLAETVDISHIDPETQGTIDDSGNVGRDMFINSITRALNALGMNGNGAKELL